MRMTVANNIKSTILKTKSAKDYIEFLKERSQSGSTDKSLTEVLMGT